MIENAYVQDLAQRLASVAGVHGVMLGGSRARGEHTPASDVDLGLYYRPPLDTAALRDVARDVAGPDAQVTEPGEWGPWVDGGGWLRIRDTAVDWIYRDMDRVHSSWSAAMDGRFQFHAQVGHPLGVPDFAYAGEVALGVVLADPTTELTRLQHATREYPPRLRRALVARLWDATFAIENARKAIARADTAYVAGCLFRTVELCAHALHGTAGRWLINEKGAVQSAGRLPDAPSDFVQRAGRILGHLGTSPDELRDSIDAAADLVAVTTAWCEARSEVRS